MTPPASDVEILPAVLTDAARIRDLTRAAYAKWVELIGREPLPMQADYERTVAEHTIDLLIV
ncbi:MAG TPA: GNAT family N-acetyltransferase, partial [Roseiarcus sp.]